MRVLAGHYTLLIADPAEQADKTTNTVYKRAPCPKLSVYCDEAGILLLRHKLGLFFMLLLGILLATLYLISATPVYEARALLEVKETGGVVDEGSSTTDFNAPEVTQEANIIKSRKVLTPVVDQFNLRNEVKPNTFAVLGDVTERVPALGKWLAGQSFAKHYAWNGETMELGKFVVPVEWEDEELSFTSLGNDRYSVSKDGQLLVESAAVGEPLRVELNPLAPMDLTVTSMRAPEGVKFDVTRRSVQETISSLHAELSTETADSNSVPIQTSHSRNSNSSKRVCQQRNVKWKPLKLPLLPIVPSAERLIPIWLTI